MCRRRVVLLGIAVFAIGTRDVQSQNSPDYQKAVQAAVSARKAGSSADKTALDIQRSLTRVPQGEVLSAIREAGYAADEAMKASLAIASTASAAVSNMLLGKYSGADVARASKTMLKTAADVATGFQRAGEGAADAVMAMTAAYMRDDVGRAVRTTYSISANALAADLRSKGQSAVAAAQTLEGAGYSVKEIGTALRDAGYDAIAIAAALKDIGLDLAATAAELQKMSYDMNTQAVALVRAYGPLAAPLAIALNSAGGTASQVANALLNAGLSLQLAASGLRAAGYATAAVGQALIGAGQSAIAVAGAMKAAGYAAQDVAAGLAAASVSPYAGAEAMKAAGFAAVEVASALKTAWNQTATQATATFKAVGFNASQTFAALVDGFGISVQIAFGNILDEFGLRDAFAAAKARGGMTLAQGVKWALEDVGGDAAQKASEIAMAVRDGWPADGFQTAAALQSSGIPLVSNAQAIKEAFAPTAKELAAILSQVVAAKTDVINALMQVMGLTQAQAAALLTN